MIEITQSYDVAAGGDPRAYAALIERTVALLRGAPGFIELRAHRNLLGAPQVRTTTVWRSLSDWAALRESPELQAIEAELAHHIENHRTQIWGPSPFLREPLRAAHHARSSPVNTRSRARRAPTRSAPAPDRR